jgi:hypothetical protein
VSPEALIRVVSPVAEEVMVAFGPVFGYAEFEEIELLEAFER